MDSMNREEFQPIKNPYIVGNPIRDKGMFFGRLDEFLYIKMKFTSEEGGGLIVLCGARRSGKTSILFQVRDGRLGPGFLPVLIDMQSMTMKDDRDFLMKLAGEIATAVDDDMVTERVSRMAVDDNPFTAFEDLVQLINQRLGGKRLVLMFDEYELFETHIDSGAITKNILNLLASLIEHKSVFVLFTGSDKLEARNRPYWSVFLAKATYRRISFLSKRDTLRLVVEPLQNEVRYAEEVPDRVYALTAGQPFYTQVICQALVDRLNELRKYEIGPDDIEGVVGEIIENPLPQMIFSWNALGGSGKLVLSVIAEITKARGGSVIPDNIGGFLRNHDIDYRLGKHDLLRELESLFIHDVLDKDPANESYSFKMDLWRLWVTRMHSIWQVVQEIGAGRPGRRLSRKIAIYASILAMGIAAIYVAMSLLGPAPEETASLTVSVEPAEADVWLDDRLIGRGEVQGYEVPAGDYLLRAALPGYADVSERITLAEGEKADLGMIVLNELRGNVRLESEPPGAEILLDGEPTPYRTPADLSDLIVMKHHQVTLRLPGYEDIDVDLIALVADSTVTQKVDLTKRIGNRTLRTRPAGADILVDGLPSGHQTPYVLGLRYGNHEIEFRKAGYRPSSVSVSVSSPEGVVEEDLVKLAPGRLEVRVEPYADIWLDGVLKEEQKSHGDFPNLDRGWHEVRLVHPALGAYAESVLVRSDSTSRVTHNFLR
jgi:hypothetical protein